MLVDLIVAAPAPLLVAGVAVYAAAVLHLVARDVERARWRRQFGGWRALQRDRIERLAQPAAPLSFALLAGVTRPYPRVRLARRSAESHRSPGELVADRLCGAARRVHPAADWGMTRFRRGPGFRGPAPPYPAPLRWGAPHRRNLIVMRPRNHDQGLTYSPRVPWKLPPERVWRAT